MRVKAPLGVHCPMHIAAGHHFFSFFLYIASMRLVTRKPPKMFTAARIRATNPRILDVQEALSMAGTATAIRAPTMITEEMALVTLISGVCRAGVTDQTTK